MVIARDGLYGDEHGKISHANRQLSNADTDCVKDGVRDGGVHACDTEFADAFDPEGIDEMVDLVNKNSLDVADIRGHWNVILREILVGIARCGLIDLRDLVQRRGESAQI